MLHDGLLGVPEGFVENELDLASQKLNNFLIWTREAITFQPVNILLF
jgi:hypothetical protein